MTVVTTMGKFTKVTTEYGIKEANQRDSGPITAHILVGTPGTVCGLLQRRQLDISALKTFVVDEADNMLDQDGLGDQTARVKSCVMTFHHIIAWLTILQIGTLPSSPLPQQPATRSYYSQLHFQTMSGNGRTDLRQRRTRLR